MQISILHHIVDLVISHVLGETVSWHRLRGDPQAVRSIAFWHLITVGGISNQLSFLTP
jgi:hypothetical protein